MDVEKEILDDLRGDNPPRCKACGVAYIDHIGHEGLCYKLQAARAALGRLDGIISGTFTLSEICDAVRDGLEASE